MTSHSMAGLGLKDPRGYIFFLLLRYLHHHARKVLRLEAMTKLVVRFEKTFRKILRSFKTLGRLYDYHKVYIVKQQKLDTTAFVPLKTIHS